MDFHKIKEILEGVFSDAGYKVANFTFTFPQEFGMSVKKIDNVLHLNFKDSLPSVKTKKLFIPFSVYLEGVTISDTGGSIKLKHFPDFNFTYANDMMQSEPRFGCTKNPSFSNSSFIKEIDREYKDDQRRRIAKIAFKYATQWADLVSQNDFQYEKENRKQLRKDCENFVKDNMIKSGEIEARSGILTFILMYFVLPAVIKWVVNKFLDNYSVSMENK
jgi:hypothetical protein